MPLTHVIDYFNSHLESFNPEASLRQQARFLYRNGQVSAELGGMSLQPFQRPILDLARLAPAAWEAKVLVTGGHDRKRTPEPLYFLSWDREDVIFLDRFLRVLHALHHLAQHGVDSPPLVVDVHWRHVQAVEASHGSVFEALLARLGLSPGQVVLRLNGNVLLAEAHARLAAQSFHRRGYPLLAHGVPIAIEESSWALLRESGVRWITQEGGTLELARRSREHFPRLAQWSRDARHAGLQVWWPGLERPGDLGIVSQLEPTLVSGSLLEEFVGAERA